MSEQKHQPEPLPEEPFNSASWGLVLNAVDETYAELLEHQTQLEAQNAELEATRGLLHSILDSVNDLLVVLDRDHRITELSGSAAEIFQAGSEDLKGKAFADLVASEDRSAMARALTALRVSPARVVLEARIEGPDGPEAFEFALSPRKDHRGRVVGAVVLGRGLGELRRAYSELAASHSELKEAQAQLVRQEKLAGLGRLLAGVAHELNNPISFVYANTHALGRYIAKFETYFAEVAGGASRARLVALREDLKLERSLQNLRAAIEGASEGSERVRDIVDDLRRLSSSGSGEQESFDLADVSQVAARWVERGSKSEITPRFHGAQSVMVSGHQGHIQQVVMNLVQNAMDALRGQEAPEIDITVGAEGGKARLTVADNGPGISEEVAASIFDPFFTTKQVGEGTGLGLAICHKIAEEHGGALTLDRADGGASFTLLLPLEAQECQECQE